MKLSFTTALLAVSISLAAQVAWAQDGIVVHMPELLVASPAAKSAGAFMTLANHSSTPDRLIGVASDAAQEVQVHRSCEDANGVVSMTHLPDGVTIPAGAEHVLARGGDHVMFMGLKHPLKPGETVSLLLRFEHAGEISIELPVVSAATASAPSVSQRCDQGAASQHGSH